MVVKGLNFCPKLHEGNLANNTGRGGRGSKIYHRCEELYFTKESNLKE
jgi:hypothetical protein